jgi:hypothetical protein
MAKIEVILNDVQTNVSAEQWAEADKARVLRDFFVANKVYGGAKDTIGKWEARKIAFKDKDTNKIVNVVWAVCYVVGETAKGSLTKSFLLSEGRCSSNGDVVAPRGDVREWADNNIVNEVLASEWTAELAKTLNTRGLIMEREKYQQSKKDGGAFAAAYMHPFFADTFKAE